MTRIDDRRDAISFGINDFVAERPGSFPSARHRAKVASSAAGRLSVLCCLRKAGSDLVPVCLTRPGAPDVVTALRAENAELKAENAELRALVTKLAERVARLERLISRNPGIRRCRRALMTRRGGSPRSADRAGGWSREHNLGHDRRRPQAAVRCHQFAFPTMPGSTDAEAGLKDTAPADNPNTSAYTAATR